MNEKCYVLLSGVLNFDVKRSRLVFLNQARVKILALYLNTSQLGVGIRVALFYEDRFATFEVRASLFAHHCEFGSCELSWKCIREDNGEDLY